MDTWTKQKFSNEVLEYLLDWINDNLDPEEVFSEDQLREWASYYMCKDCDGF